eukprot:2347791-Amphidinium_carterae.1
MFYLQLFKEGTKNAGERRPIAPSASVRLWSACCRADVLKWKNFARIEARRLRDKAPLTKPLTLRILLKNSVRLGSIKLVFSLIVASATSGFRC